MDKFIEALKATVRDVVLAGVAAFAGAAGVVTLAVAGGADVTVPYLKAAAVAAAWAALRAMSGVLAAKLAK